MDLQFCYDGYAVITYLTDYITKVDAGLTKAMRNTINETKGCNDFERLNKVKKAYFTHRQVSVAEATYRLTFGMDLKYSNVKSRFVATGFPENRSDKFMQVQDKEDGCDEDYDDYESESEVEEDIEEDIEEKGIAERPDYIRKSKQKLYNLPGRQGKFTKVSTIHKKYVSRPNCLENICLAQFAIMFENCDRPKRDIVFNDGASDKKGKFQIFGSDMLLPKYIKMKIGGFMRQRLFTCILKIHSSKKKKQKDEGIYSELVLFFPWQDEKLLRINIQEVFNSNYDMIERNKRQIYPGSKMIDQMRELIENPDDDGKAKHIYENIDVAGQQENLDDEQDMEPLDTTVWPEEDPQPKNIKSDGMFFKPIIVDEDEIMLEMA